MDKIHHHFSRIAQKYKDIRTTDLEPILFIKKKLEGLSEVEAADVGSGVGRYDIELFNHLGKRLSLTCIDSNDDMLKELTKNLKEHKIENFNTIKAQADFLPLSNNSLDCIVTFNAVHHFELSGFLQEASRILKSSGTLFIYTRLRSQNKENIWGRFFPRFYEKESRLKELNELKEILIGIPILKSESIEYFKFKRMANLEWLIAQAMNHHYSTFSLYDEEEFNESLKKFEENIARHFKDSNQIVWDDEYTMLVIRKNRGE